MHAGEPEGSQGRGFNSPPVHLLQTQMALGKAYHNSGVVSRASWKEISPRSRKKNRRMHSYSEWSYYASLDEIYHAQWSSEASAKLLAFREAIDSVWPEGYPVKLIQVAGTSGKGSTCKFLQAGLSLYGRAGCYVKPHVFDYAERFTAEKGQVDHDEIVDVWRRDVKPICVDAARRGGAPLDHQETSILVALRVFERHRLRWAAVETGIGGRYDPVSALPMVVTVLTNVGRDHEDVLGSEHWQRALEKAGICRPGVPLVLGDNDPKTEEVVAAVCDDSGSPVVKTTAEDVRMLRRLTAKIPPGRTSLAGSEHQLWNAATAVKTIRLLVPSADLRKLARQFIETKYVGRFWKVAESVYADVAHNPSKTGALADEIEKRFPRRKKVFVVGISGQRSPTEVIGPLVGQARAVVVTAAGYKGQDPKKVFGRLQESFPSLEVRLIPDPRETLEVARNMAKEGEPVVYTGSTYMIDQALNPDERLRHINGTYGWRGVREK